MSKPTQKQIRDTVRAECLAQFPRCEFYKRVGCCDPDGKPCGCIVPFVLRGMVSNLDRNARNLLDDCVKLAVSD